MSQIKKKFIADKAIDGSKILLQNNEALKALNSLGVERSIMKFNSSNALEFIEMPEISADPTSGNQLTRKSYADNKVSVEQTRAMGEESRIEGKVDQEISDRQSAVSAEQSRAQGEEARIEGLVESEESRAMAAEAALEGRLDVLEGADNVSGSVSKALKDAKDYADEKISDLVNGAPGVLDTLKELSDALGGDENFAATLAGQMAGLDGRLDTLEGDETTSGSLAKTLKDAKDYTDAEVAEEIFRATAREDSLENSITALTEISFQQLNILTADIRAEVHRATQVEFELNGRLNVVEGDEWTDGSVAKAEKDAKYHADSIVATEQSRAEGEEERIEGRLDQEISDRQSAVSSEQSRAEVAESALEARLDILEGADSVEGSVAKAEKDAKDYADGIMSTEQSARQTADEDLQDQIDTEKGRIDAILLAADADKDSFAEIVTLINSVDTTNDSAFASYVLSNDAALAAEEARAEGEEQRIEGKVDQEISDRQAAVLAVKVAVSIEQSARESADSALDARLDVIEGDYSVAGSVAKAENDAKLFAVAEDAIEAAARTEADNALDARLLVLESDPTTKAYVDGRIETEQGVRDAEVMALSDRLDILESDPITMTAVNAAIASEQSAREAANSAMDSRVDALEAVQHRKESFTLGATEVSNGYVELSMEAMASSTVVFVGRLGAIEGVDYSVSVVSGKTRITWTGELASGGASELVSGDKVHVKFMK